MSVSFSIAKNRASFPSHPILFCFPQSSESCTLCPSPSDGCLEAPNPHTMSMIKRVHFDMSEEFWYFYHLFFTNATSQFMFLNQVRIWCMRKKFFLNANNCLNIDKNHCEQYLFKCIQAEILEESVVGRK